jgi:hypothetical protein
MHTVYQNSLICLGVIAVVLGHRHRWSLHVNLVYCIAEVKYLWQRDYNKGGFSNNYDRVVWRSICSHNYLEPVVNSPFCPGWPRPVIYGACIVTIGWFSALRWYGPRSEVLMLVNTAVHAFVANDAPAWSPMSRRSLPDMNANERCNVFARWHYDSLTICAWTVGPELQFRLDGAVIRPSRWTVLAGEEGVFCWACQCGTW